ncbi:hypothetical protein : [Gemmataceae bacterium]|nr:hypothetical protein : [Gemmataceae bacterium]VTU02309.1 hypothetical protein : [Gemmataceae bacterium]
MRATVRWMMTAVLFAATAAAQAAPVPAAPAKAADPMSAVRKALDEVGDMNYEGRTLLDVVTDLKEKSKLNIVLDSSLGNFGLDVNQPVINVNLKQVKLKDGLKKVLEPYNLKFGTTRDGVYISTEDGVTTRQLRQRVSVDCDGTDFGTAIKQLAADSGANVVVDPRLGEKTKKAVTLKLEDVPLETAVRLLAEVADLRAVRMANVLFVTTHDKAKVLREDGDGPTGSTPANPVFPLPGVGFPGGGGIGGVQILPAQPAVDPAVPPQPAPAPDKPVQAPERAPVEK